MRAGSYRLFDRVMVTYKNVTFDPNVYFSVLLGTRPISEIRAKAAICCAQSPRGSDSTGVFRNGWTKGTANSWQTARIWKFGEHTVRSKTAVSWEKVQ